MFKSQWLSDPKFSSWLSGTPGVEMGYCTLCNEYFTVSDGRGSLRAHARGINHKEVVGGREMQIIPSISSSRNSSNSIKASKKKKPQVAEINSCLINAPGTSNLTRVRERIFSTRPSQTVTQAITVSDHLYAISSHESRSARSSVAYRSRSSSNSSSSSDAPSRSHSRNNYGNRNTRRFVEEIENLHSFQDLVIGWDSIQFLKFYKGFLRKAGISSEPRFKLKRELIKEILEDYETQHRNLRESINRRLVEVVNK